LGVSAKDALEIRWKNRTHQEGRKGKRGDFYPSIFGLTMRRIRNKGEEEKLEENGRKNLNMDTESGLQANSSPLLPGKGQEPKNGG
jgi:hypothetical protein